jgi:hypothetical protein
LHSPFTFAFSIIDEVNLKHLLWSLLFFMIVDVSLEHAEVSFAHPFHFVSRPRGPRTPSLSHNDSELFTL